MDKELRVWRSALVVLLALSLQAAAIWVSRAPLVSDDAPFTFRYAESIASGEGFRWNADEKPVWGASAPLWTLLLGGLTRLGSRPEIAAVAAGTVLVLASAALLALAALRSVGLSAALWCGLFAAVNWRFSSAATNGMEGPVALLLVSASLLALTTRGTPVLTGVLAGLSFVQKIDFLPFGLLLLAATWMNQRKFPRRAALIALGIAFAWYAFAWAEFGAVVPNSFLTKLSIDGSVGRTWFSRIALLEGGRPLLLLSAGLAVPMLWRHRPLLFVCVGLIGYFTLGYTLRPPDEHFQWYQAPVQPALVFLAGCGAGGTLQWLLQRTVTDWRAALAVQCVALVMAGFMVRHRELPLVAAQSRYLSNFERDRSDAGKWIDAHTPAGATLLTGYGHIAYQSRRRTIDFTFLNRLPPRLPVDALIARYQPDVIAICPYRTGVAPSEYETPPGYRVAAVFDRTWRNRVGDFYVVVLTRQPRSPAFAP